MEYNNPNDPWMYDPYKGLDDDERMKAGCLQLASYLVMIFIGLLLCALFSGCTTTKYVPVIEHHTDTVRVVKVQHDSLVLKDSVYIHDKGDTILIEKWHTQYRDRWRTDTIYQSKTDSIPAPYPVEVIKEVPAELTMWQRLKMKVGGAAIILCLLAFLIWVWRSK
jgi:hypothetical protein